MPFDNPLCDTCAAPAVIEKTFNISNKHVSKLTCGHFAYTDLNCSTPEHFVSLDNKHLYPFQVEGVKFGLSSPEYDPNENIRILIADEMGLGKTPQSLGILATAKAQGLDVFPVLKIVKSSLKTQWQHESMRWLGEDTITQVIDSPKDFILPGCTSYIMSYDVLRRFATSRKEKVDMGIDVGEDTEFLKATSYTETEKSKKKDAIINLIERLKIKTVILDECQQIKNHESQRAMFVRIICKHVKHVIALSGTPIKNNAAEYWTILNILRPDLYPTYSTFVMRDCESYFSGYGMKTGGLKDPERFLEKNKHFIIRRERKEVLPDLPPIRRSFQFCELSKEVEDAYLATFKEFRDDYDSEELQQMASFEREAKVLAYLSKMRHLTGLSKIDPCIDYVMEVMGSTEDRITIFTHHNDVAEILTNKLNKLFIELNIPPCARHQAGSQSKDTEVAFEKTRVLICSTLAGGEGLNLQRLCFRFVMLERQWNPANEEQAEARFPRPEGIEVDSIDGVYMVATGTVDEFFAEIVEQKREIVGKTLSGKAAEWDQTSIMKQLSEVLAASGGKRWGI